MVSYFDTSIDVILTEVTIGAFEDLGYEVNYDAADSIPLNRKAARRMRKRSLNEDNSDGNDDKGIASLDGKKWLSPSELSSEVRQKLAISIES